MKTIIAAVLAAAAVAAPAAADRSADTVRYHLGLDAERLVVTGCHAEDSCRIDYRAGKWVIARHDD